MRRPQANLFSKAGLFQLILFFVCLLAPASLRAQHSHINAGALTPEAGSQLYFVNGANFSTNSGFVLHLALAGEGDFAGLYNGSISFTSLPGTVATGGPAFGRAAFGAHLELEVVSVQGAAGGSFGFWQGDEEGAFSVLRLAVLSGTTNGANRFPLSENDKSPGSDPYGHIHGRRFTVDLPGLYSVGFRIVDTSGNGPGGGPLHLPSELYYMHFGAGDSIASIVKTESAVSIRADSQSGRTYYLESTENIADSASWQTIGDPLPGNGRIQAFPDHPSASPQRFYRLRVTTP